VDRADSSVAHRVGVRSDLVAYLARAHHRLRSRFPMTRLSMARGHASTYRRRNMETSLPHLVTQTAFPTCQLSDAAVFYGTISTV
jgi:hypothetical protein